MLNIYIHLIQYAIYILILTEYTRVCFRVIFIILSFNIYLYIHTHFKFIYYYFIFY